jgi:hypothetical protein
VAGAANAGGFPAFVGPLHQVTTLASTVPANGDVNPYGVAVIPRSTGRLGQGNTLVSNFNDKANAQGTGTTIVQITPHGHVSLFAQINPHLRGCPGGVGLTTALVTLRSGWVIVGSLRKPIYRDTPTRTGSGASDTPNASRTPSLISRASAISAAVLAEPELTRASVCLDEIRAPSPGS